MVTDNLENTRIRLDEERLELEKTKLSIENSFFKRYGTALLGVLGTIVAGFFVAMNVYIASEQNIVKLETARILKEKEIALADISRNKRLRLDITDFVFRNRKVIFSNENNDERKAIINVIAVTFPPEISEILFENLKEAIPDQKQKQVIVEGQKLVENIQLQQTSLGKRYFVIAMTSARKEDIDNEIQRVARLYGSRLKKDFPFIKTYAPEGGLFTLLVSSKSLPYSQAKELERLAKEAGFSKDTWMWSSNKEYFSSTIQ